MHARTMIYSSPHWDRSSRGLLRALKTDKAVLLSHTITTRRLPIETIDVKSLLVHDPDILARYNEDQYTAVQGEATLLARPASELEVAALMAWADARGVPVTIVGRKTGLTGGATPLGRRQPGAGSPPLAKEAGAAGAGKGRAGADGKAGGRADGSDEAGQASKARQAGNGDAGKGRADQAGRRTVLALSTEKLTRLDIDVAGQRAVVGPGVLQGELWRACAEAKGPGAPDGLLYPPDPTSRDDASVGGGVACNASGARTFRYGPTRDWVVGLRVVLPSRELLVLRRGEVCFGPDDTVTIETATGAGAGAGKRKGTEVEGKVEAAVDLEAEVEAKVEEEAGGHPIPISESRVLRLPGYATPDGKNATGYHSRPGMDLIDLFIGEEGTLGVITRVEVRLTPQPADRFQLLVGFASRSAALTFVKMARELPEISRPVAVEWLDDAALKLVGLHQPHHLPFAINDIAAVLVLEVELRPGMKGSGTGPVRGKGEAIPSKAPVPEAMEVMEVMEVMETPEPEAREAAVAHEAESLEELRERLLEKWAGRLEDHAPTLVLTAITRNQIERFRQLRHAVASTVNELVISRDVPKLSTDTRVPFHELADYMEWIYSITGQAGLEAVSYGHVGDGHVHFNLLARDIPELEQAREVYHAIVSKAVTLGGVVSAEHGIGKIKREYLAVQVREDGLNGMRALKLTLDPNGILGPGNLFERSFADKTRRTRQSERRRASEDH